MARFRELLAMFAMGAVTGIGVLVLLTTSEAQSTSMAPPGAWPPPAVVTTQPTPAALETVELPAATTRTLLRWGALEATTQDELLADLAPEIVNVVTASRTAMPVWEER